MTAVRPALAVPLRWYVEGSGLRTKPGAMLEVPRPPASKLPATLAFRVAGAALMLTLLGGCALTDGHVRLNPVPSGTAAQGGQGREVIVFPVVDERADSNRCGVKRNTWEAETADVLCEPEPRQWLGELVLRAVDRAGFKVVTTQTARSADPLHLRIKLKHLFIDQVNGVVTLALITDAHVVIEAETPSGLVAKRSFFAKSRNEVLGVLDSGLQASMDEAVDQLAKEMVTALIGLNARYPSAGARARAADQGPVLAQEQVRP